MYICRHLCIGSVERVGEGVQEGEAGGRGAWGRGYT